MVAILSEELLDVFRDFVMFRVMFDDCIQYGSGYKDLFGYIIASVLIYCVFLIYLLYS